MDLDAVHDMNSWGDQAVLPPVSSLIEESTPYEAAFSYDELFPSLPDNEVKPEVPQVDMGQWTQKMKVKSSVITQVYRVPMEERKFRDMNNQRFGEQGEQVKICADIMQRTGAHIEISSSKDQSLTVLITGKEDAVLNARRYIGKDLQTQVVINVPIPKEHHRFILGKLGKRLAELELNTATKISVPRPDENSDLIRIVGPKEGIDQAQHEIQSISDEQDKKAFERFEIDKEYHPFIFGPFNEVLNKIISETGARVNIPPASVMKNDITISGEKEAVARAKQIVMQIYEERKSNCQSVSVEVPKNQHRYIIGHRGQTIQEILQETGVSVEMPSPDKHSDTITLRGDQAKLGPALTMVYSKATSVKTEILNVPSWLHKYIIGKKGANIKHLTSDLLKVQVDFLDDTIKVEGPPEEVTEACKKLLEITETWKKEVAFEEVKINPNFHRHIIGKNGSNINRLKELTNAQINIPPDGDNDIVRLEGSPKAVAEMKILLQEIVQKMENEITTDLKIEQRFHRNIIGAKGEKIREIRDKFNQVNITFPELGLKSDKVSIRGPKPDVDECFKYLQKVHEDMKVNSYSVDVPICKQNHKHIIGKGGSVIKKIREDKNVRIDLPGEGSESEIITISGRKEDVHAAREKVLAIQKDLDNVVQQEIMIPAKLHNSIIGSKGRLIRSITEECGGVTIKFPTSDTISDKVIIRGLKDDVLKAKKILVELSNERQLTGFSAEVQAKPEHHKFLIGKNGANIKKVRDKTGARIVFPNENDEDRDTISIIGRKEEVEAAKQELNNLIAELKNTGEMRMEIELKHHRHFVARRAEVLRQIADEFGGVSVSFPKMGVDEKTVVLKGPHDYLQGAKQRLLEIVEDLEAMVTVECVIAQEHHRTVLGTRGTKVQGIQQQFSVTIKFPDRARPEDNERVTMNGDHSDAPDGDTNQRNKIIIRGKPENCEAASQALLDLVPVTETMEVPYDLHRFIIGQKGKDVRGMMEQYDVNILIPQQTDQSDVITIKGPPINVEMTKIALKKRIEQLELEKQERFLRSFQLTVEVDPALHSKLIGRNGEIIKKIRSDNKVTINLPERDSTNDKVITITGYEKDAKAARDEILKFVEFQENMYKEEIQIESNCHSRIIGAKGRNIQKIMEEFKVYIRFARESDPDPNSVFISGAEEDVLDAKEHLLNMNEEFAQEATERDLLKKYFKPPSRNGNHDWEGCQVNDKGFVVKGAPWEKKNAAPDTSNTQEFPSFGSGGEVAAKPVAWGPSRR